ncbi:hypothetical protein BN1723_015216, partial [Verticillium longisporum]
MNDSEDAVHHREVDLSRIEAPSTHKTYVICAFAAFGGICFGYQTAVMSGLLGTPYFIELYTNVDFDYTTYAPVDKKTSTASNWFWNCVIATCTPFLVGGDKGEANLGPKIFFILGSTCCLSLAFAYFLVPEMKDLSLEQIEMMMNESSPRCSPAYRVLKGFTQMRGDRVLRQMRSVSADCESSKLTPRSHVVEEGGR